MKFKTILIIVLISIIVFLIYLTTIDRKVYYLDLGDDASINNNSYNKIVENYLNKKDKLEKSVFLFSTKDYRTTDLIRDIEDNKKINNQTIKNALIKADILTLSIGSNDIYYKITSTSPQESYQYIDNVVNDLDKLLEIIRKYCKEDIIMLNYYNAYQSNYDPLFTYVNNKLDELGKVYNIKIVDTTEILVNKTLDNKLPNKKEYEMLGNKIIKIINEEVFSK